MTVPSNNQDKTWQWILLGGLAILLLLPLLTFGVWRSRLARDVNTELQAIRDAGLPTSGAELNAYYPEVPDEENAALVLMAAFELLQHFTDNRSNELAQLSLSPKEANLSPEDRELLTVYVQMNEAAIARAREGLQLPKSRYPVDMSAGFNTLLPHLAKLRNLGRAISYQGTLAASAGRHDETFDAAITILKLADTLADEPLVISALISFALDKIAADTLAWGLNAGSVGEEHLSQLHNAFRGPARTNVLYRAMVGERAVAIPLFRGSFAQLARFADTEDDLSGSEAHDTFATVPLTALMRTSGFWERDLKFYLQVMDRTVALAALSPPASLAMTSFQEQVFGELPGKRYIMSGMFLIAPSKAFVRHAQAVAHRRLSDAALTVESFRNRNQRLPVSVAELAADRPADWPLDPFDGQPLRYERLPVGYVVYSVGADGQDDGGRERPPRVKSTDQTTYDITFVVER